MRRFINQIAPAAILLLAFRAVVVAEDAAGKTDQPDGKPAAKSAEPPRPVITVSKETTYIKGPLRKDGYVDYVAALNERFSKGVTPENNAAVPFWQAIGPAAIDEAQRDQFFKLLGIEPLAEKGDYFVDYGEFLKQRGIKDPHETAIEEAAEKGEEPPLDQQSLAMRSRPWTEKEHPLVSDWLKANEKPLLVVADGLERPRHYTPLVASSEDSMVVEVLLPAIQKQREVARALLARAMLRLGEGKHEEAWSDLLAMHRLAQHVSKGGTLIEGLVAIAIDAMACGGDAALAHHGKLTAEEAKQYGEELAALGPLAPMADKIETAERFMFLDAVSLMAREGPKVLAELVGTETTPTIDAIGSILTSGLLVDWDETLRVGNDWYDRLGAGFRKPSFAERRAAFVRIGDELDELNRDLDDLTSMATHLLLGGESPRKLAGRQIGERLIALLLPAVATVSEAEDRAVVNRRMAETCFALAAHRTEHGKYPKKLSELAPKYVPDLPIDPCSGKELHYSTTDEGFVVYSVGPNGKDDGGSFDTSKGQDDRAIVVPAVD